MKLDKIVVHTKNVIFLRVLLLILVIVILARIMTGLFDDLDKTRKGLDNVSVANTAVQDKLETVTGVQQGKIHDMYKNYELFLDYGYDFSCVERLEFVRSAKGLKGMLSLPGDVIVDVQNQVDSSWERTRKAIRVQTDIVTVKFAVATLEQFESAMRYMNNILPKYGVIRFAVADMQEFLTPDVVGHLQGEGGPALILCEVVVDLQDIMLL